MQIVQIYAQILFNCELDLDHSLQILRFYA